MKICNNNIAIVSIMIIFSLILSIINVTCLIFNNDNAAQNGGNKLEYQVPSATLTILKKKKQIDAAVVKSGQTLKKSIEATEGKHSIRVSFYCIEANTKTGETKPGTPHQAFVSFTNAKTNRDTFFSAALIKNENNNEHNNNNDDDSSKGNHFVATIDLLKEAGRFKSASETYDLTIFVGSHNVNTGHQWRFGAIKLNFKEINDKKNSPKTHNQRFDAIFDSSEDLTTATTPLKEIKMVDDESIVHDHNKVITSRYLYTFTLFNILVLVIYLRLNNDGVHEKKKV
jgi:hypothetical protein